MGTVDLGLPHVGQQQKSGFKGLIRAKPYLIFWSLFACIGSFLYGTDQGVLSNLLTGENFGSKFPHVYTNPTLKGWVVAVLQLGAWLGALINGPLADRISRKYSLTVAGFVRGIASRALQVANCDFSCLLWEVQFLPEPRASRGFLPAVLSPVSLWARSHMSSLSISPRFRPQSFEARW